MSVNLRERPYYVFVQGQFANKQSGQAMVSHPSGRFKVCQSIAASDVVVWTGGEDIYPGIYNQKPIDRCYFNKERDNQDVKAIAMADSKVKIGICRGAQLLNCWPNNGELWQDVNNHGNYHVITDFVTKEKYTCNSLHHQMMIPGPGALIVAGNEVSTRKENYKQVWHRQHPAMNPDWSKYQVDPEVVWYQKSNSLCFQGHPEFGHPETTAYFHQLVDRYVLPALTDIDEKRRASLG
jgi:hypothetical protein